MIPNYFVLAFSLFLALVHGSHDQERKPYIVYMGDIPRARTLSKVLEDHHSLLSATTKDEKIARESRIYSYQKSFNGFAARLLPEEAERLSEKSRVVSVFANTKRKLHTTATWDFLGLSEKSNRNSEEESNIIVGVLDTGIYVDSPSFSDKGLGPPPSKWKGKCMEGGNFTGCNNKVIGARYYNLDNSQPEMEEPTPADNDGHGTHTASTAAGSIVPGASLYGIAKGTARGGAPSARIAVYKACWGGGCSDMDLLAAFDDAIADGVDLISVSIGAPSKSFFNDPIAIGSFHAMKKGILTSCSAGNSGPYESTVENVAPWILTVAASGINRQFRAAVKLGNGMETSGLALNTFAPEKEMYPLTSGSLAGNTSSGYDYGNHSACDYGTLSKDKVEGKIVYCLGSGNQDYTIKSIGGAGVIIALDEETDAANAAAIPATYVFQKEGKKIDQYINSTKNAKAVIHKTTTVTITAPFVASFSSRGPQTVNLNILKPDIAAPGLAILAAYSKLVSITNDPTDKRYSPFNIVSGTSMACPHAAGAAAYVKSFHPDWSPAAIKSALMTTARPMKIKGDDAELGSGSGQINPVKAVHPGLVYEISMNDYIRFLCKEGYNNTLIGQLVGGKQNFSCSNFKPAVGTDGLNYPSMHIQYNTTNATKISGVFHRRLTNVENEKSTYKANVTTPKGLSIKIVPNILKFDQRYQKRTFKVLVKGSFPENGERILSAWLEWSDSKHSVRSPILVYKPLPPFVNGDSPLPSRKGN